MQLYRGLDIGTAKLTPTERAGVPHHLLDVLDVTETASVAAYQRAARAVIERLRAAGRTPVLVGGSGLYVQAVLDELEFPGTDPALRAELEAELAERGPAVLHARLAGARPGRGGGRAARQRAAHRARAGGDRADRAPVPGPAAHPRPAPLRRGADRDRPGHRRAGPSGSPAGWPGCSRPGWSRRPAGCCPAGCATGRTASRALGYQQVLAALGRGRRADRGRGGHGPGHPPVRPPAALLVPPGPPDPLAGRRRPGPARAGPCPARRRARPVGSSPCSSARATAPRTTSCCSPTRTAGSSSPRRVAALCDRRRGLGADGLLRVVRWAALGAAGPAPEPGVEWFMDYRNADGSVAEMCGNGVRVYARYLADRGWLTRQPRCASAPAPGCARCTWTGRRSPSTWARPCSARPAPRGSATGRSPGSRSTSAIRIWPASPTPRSTPWT